jgi:hypothetical protein
MSEFDELASAYLDNEVTPEERTRVESDATLRERVEELRATRDALSSEPVEPPPSAARAAAIAAALDASKVIRLESRRRRRSVRVASIAAAVLVVLGAAGLLIRAQSDSTEDRFTTAAGALSTTTSLGPLAERSAAGAAAAAGNDAGAFSPRTSLGTFGDRASLAAAARVKARDTIDGNKSASPSTTTAADSGRATSGVPSTTCAVSPPPDATSELYAASAVLEGRSVQVDVFTTVDGSLQLVVTDAASCGQLFSQLV